MVTSSTAKNAKPQVVPRNRLQANSILAFDIIRVMLLVGLCSLLLCDLIVTITSIIILPNSIAAIGATTLI